MTKSTTGDVPEFARANLPSDPRKSPRFYVPEYMKEPRVYNKFGVQIRIWRAETKDLKKTGEYRRCVGLLEWTWLDRGLTLGLKWYYSMYQKEAWKEFKYILYSHCPGSQPCKDLADVYRSTTAEIKWFISRLQVKFESKTRPIPMIGHDIGVFPR